MISQSVAVMTQTWDALLTRQSIGVVVVRYIKFKMMDTRADQREME